MKKVMKDSESLANFLATFPTRHELSVAIDKIASGCMVARPTIHNWSRGLCRIPELHKHKIEEIFGKKIFYSLETK